MELHKDFKEFIKLLNEHSVAYIIVGGYAMAFHGYPRFTGDIDFFVKPDRDNAKKIISVLKDFGFSSLDISEDDFVLTGRVIQLGFPPVRIDIVTSISGVSWQEAFDGREQINLDDLSCPFIGRKQFIQNKKAIGRHKDLSDIESLDG
jgi:hypothetical protein